MWRGESALVYHNVFMLGKDNVLLKTCDVFIKSSGGREEAPKGLFPFLDYLFYIFVLFGHVT